MDKTIIKNIISLFSVQGINYLIPLLTLPFLVKNLTPEGYGELSLSIALVQYFICIVDYGFNLSGTKQIVKYKDNKNKISRIFWSIITTKLILTILSSLILLILINNIEQFQKIKYIILLSFISVFGNLITPTWLFHGKEEISTLSFISIISRISIIPLIFILIEQKQDIYFAAIILSSSSIFTGIISLIFIYYKNWIVLKKISMRLISLQLRQSWHYFLSIFSVSLYTTSTTVILGIIAGPVAVGYFVAVDKLRMAVQGIIPPISQALYPRINSIYITNKYKAIVLIKKIIIVQSMIILILSSILYIISPYIINILYGNDYINTISTLKILSFVPLLVSISNILGTHTLLVMNHSAYLSKIILFGAICNLLIIYPLINLFNYNGAALSTLITELIVSLLMSYIIIKRNLLSNKNRCSDEI